MTTETPPVNPPPVQAEPVFLSAPVTPEAGVSPAPEAPATPAPAVSPGVNEKTAAAEPVQQASARAETKSASPVPMAFSILRGLLILCALLISFVALVLSFKALRFGQKYQALAAEYRKLKESADATRMAAREKRKHPRVFRLVEVDFSVLGRFYRGFIRNLSVGGAFIETREAFTVGQEITVSYPAPNSEGNIKRNGEIARKVPHGIAIRFLPQTF